mmetsp:Transcript_3759/g.8286  ORF Transcript_3759/g.8286 Transcript_3759/m.8286 type:complete len:674 (-) Transcript_3759:94-2115(-)
MSFENDVDLTLWEPFPDVPNTSDDYRGYAMASSRDVVYISGGCSGNAIGSDNTKVNRSLISFNMSTRKWTELPNMNYHRWGHRLAVVEGGRYLFAIGGWGYKNNTSHGNTGNGKEKKKMSIRSALRKVDIEEKHPIEKLTSYEVYDVSNHVWKEAGELNEPRRDFAMTVDGTSGKIYIFGGVGTNGALSTAEVYNPYEGKWVYLNEALPEAKRWCHALLVGSLIHILDTGKNTLTYNTTTNAWLEDPPDESIVPRCPSNGKVCTTSSFSEGQVLVYGYPVKDVDHGTLSNRWMIVHIGNNKRCKSWTVLPPADEFMYYRCTASDGKLIIGTGNNMISFQITDNATEDGGSTVAPSSASSVEGSLKGGSVLSGGGGRIVEPIKDDGTWKLQPEISSKPKDFRGYAVASAGDLLFISGGCSGDGTLYRSFLCYNVVTQKWKKLPGMTHRRLGHKMAVSTDGRYLYVIGGGDGKTLRSMGVDVYDVLKETWTAAPAMNHYRVFFGFTVCSKKIYVFGGIGSNNGSQLSSVEVYDPDTNGWEFVSSMPEERGVCNVITVGHAIYVFGTPSQRVLSYDTLLDKWFEETESPLPAMPPGGCVCAASAYIGGEVLVFKYPLRGQQNKHRRTAHIYNASSHSWKSVNLLDEFACYSAIVAGAKCVVVTPQNQLQACILPRD